MFPEMITKLLEILGSACGSIRLQKQTQRHFSHQMEFPF